MHWWNESAPTITEGLGAAVLVVLDVFANRLWTVLGTFHCCVHKAVNVSNECQAVTKLPCLHGIHAPEWGELYPLDMYGIAQMVQSSVVLQSLTT